MPLNIDLQQILLHMFNFVLLFGIAYFLLYSPIKKFMDKRTAEYKEMDDEAKKALEDAQATKKDYEQKMKEAEREIVEMKKQASREAGDRREEILARTHVEADTIIKNAQKRADMERELLIADTRREIESIVSDAAKTMIAEKSVSEEYDAFLNAAEKKESENG
ncbi:MAG: ATP synthase F0 subunit B [Lachnospiraceae bacterium]|nr:ATP synthase F0 subunit B [Lachnospiraceae bacterium]